MALSEQIERLSQGSPFAREVGSVLNFFANQPDSDELLQRVTIPDLKDLFRNMGMRGLEVSTRGGHTCTIVPAEDGSFTVVTYGTQDERSAIAGVYEGYTHDDPQRYTPDTRMLALRVDANSPKPEAIPVVLLADNQEPMTGGRIAWEPFNPASNLIRPIIDKMSKTLENGDVTIGIQRFPRQPQTQVQTY